MVATIKRFIGKSNEPKPHDHVKGERIPDGSTFFEEDTGNMYSFAGGDWSLKEDSRLALRLEIKTLLGDLLAEQKITNEKLELVVDALGN
jgi:hypothetical protein